MTILRHNSLFALCPKLVLYRHHPLFVFVSLSLFLPFVLSGAQPATSTTIYFYSPETNINNFSSLKAEFDIYLSQFGAYRFQPFSERLTFETFIAKSDRAVFLLSTWHYQNLKRRLSMEPVLVGVSRNQSTQRRVLSVQKSFTDIGFLKGIKIASSGSAEFTTTILKHMLHDRDSAVIASMKIFSVPKDIDALLAVGFGMSTAAFTTQNSLEKFENINPKQFNTLRQIAVSSETLFPIVARQMDSADQVQDILDIMEKMGDDPEGEKRLKMLGLDSLKKLSNDELEMLNK